MIYYAYYDDTNKLVCVERHGNRSVKVLAGSKPTGLYSRMLLTDTYALSEAIDEALLTKQELLNKSKGKRYQRSPELEHEIRVDVSYAALKTKYGISKRTYYRLRNEIISSQK